MHICTYKKDSGIPYIYIFWKVKVILYLSFSSLSFKLVTYSFLVYIFNNLIILFNKIHFINIHLLNSFINISQCPMLLWFANNPSKTCLV